VKQRFPKSLRLRKRFQFLQMNHQAKRLVGRFLIIDYKQNILSFTRLGITVSKKHGDAHERNRFKRIVREAFRLSYGELRQGLDLNIRPRSASKDASATDLMQEIKKLLKA